MVEALSQRVEVDERDEDDGVLDQHLYLLHLGLFLEHDELQLIDVLDGEDQELRLVVVALIELEGFADVVAVVRHQHLDVLGLLFLLLPLFEVHLLAWDSVGNLDQVAQEVFFVDHAVYPRRRQHLFLFFVFLSDCLGDPHKGLLGLQG